MSLASRILQLLEDKWSGDVKVKVHPPEGLFAKGSAEEIANWAWKAHKGDLKSAMASLNFYINRGGKKLPPDQEAKIEKAKELLRKKASKK